VVLARHALNEVHAERASLAPGLRAPAFARLLLEAPGMLDEYLALRGLDAEGRLRGEARAALGTPRVLNLAHLEPPTSISPSRPAPPQAGATRGPVTVRSSGSIAEVLGSPRTVAVTAPATVAAVLREAAGTGPARALLFREHVLVPSVWRAGRRLDAEDEVRPGDVLDLLTAISGG
jgi:hypothetical protein